jgi:hypothetical protein
MASKMASTSAWMVGIVGVDRRGKRGLSTLPSRAVMVKPRSEPLDTYMFGSISEISA